MSINNHPPLEIFGRSKLNSKSPDGLGSQPVGGICGHWQSDPQQWRHLGLEDLCHRIGKNLTMGGGRCPCFEAQIHRLYQHLPQTIDIATSKSELIEGGLTADCYPQSFNFCHYSAPTIDFAQEQTIRACSTTSTASS